MLTIQDMHQNCEIMRWINGASIISRVWFIYFGYEQRWVSAFLHYLGLNAEKNKNKKNKMNMIFFYRNKYKYIETLGTKKTFEKFFLINVWSFFVFIFHFVLYQMQWRFIIKIFEILYLVFDVVFFWNKIHVCPTWK